LDNNNLLAALGSFSSHGLLGAGLQHSPVVRLGTHALNRVHHICLLVDEGVAQLRGPLDISSHALHDIGKRCQRLDTRIPVLLLHRGEKRVAPQILVPLHPLLQLDKVQWIGRSDQDLRQKRIRIKRDRRNERIQFIIRNLGGFFRRRSWRLRCRHDRGLPLRCLRQHHRRDGPGRHRA